MLQTALTVVSFAPDVQVHMDAVAVESFNGRMRDELLNGEIFYSLRET